MKHNMARINSTFLKHLTFHSFFNWLANFKKTRQTWEHIFWKRFLATQKEMGFLLVNYEHNDNRVHTWIAYVARYIFVKLFVVWFALLIWTRSFVTAFIDMCLRATSRTKLVPVVPTEQWPSLCRKTSPIRVRSKIQRSIFFGLKRLFDYGFDCVWLYLISMWSGGDKSIGLNRMNEGNSCTQLANKSRQLLS